MQYNKDNPRIVVNIIDSDTEETVLTIKDRNWMNVGELFTQTLLTRVLKQELGADNMPNNVIVMIADEFTLEQ